MNVRFILLIIIILILNVNKIYNDEILRENYLNCPNEYNNNLQDIFYGKKIDQYRGYTKNNYLYTMEFIENDEPLPINSNFFNNEY